MITEGMYVRCPIDEEKYVRDFALGKVIAFDDFTELAEIEFFDTNEIGVFYQKPENCKIKVNKISHSKIRNGSNILYKKRKYTIKGCRKNKDTGKYYYYLQSPDDVVELVSESLIEASFNDGYVFPMDQLKTYEFQNPMWFLGRTVVSRTMQIINNSLYGFSEIAGCKIYLKTHQLRTIMRCLQDGNCRNMIADEVGMGKTIEASAVLKIYLNSKHNSNVAIIVPEALKEQWRTELAYKFRILEGKDINNNEIHIIAMDNISRYECDSKYDFVIADEVHKYLHDSNKYQILLNLSKKADNILMLSATPVQRRKEEYKKLLQLIQPEKYLKMSDERFEELMNLQGDVVRRVHEALEELDSYLEEIEDSDNKHTEDTEDAFDEVIGKLERIQKLIHDDTFEELYEEAEYDSDDFGIESIQNAIAYVCENYQFEKSIIRNRRNDDDEDNNVRELEDISYDMQTNFNNAEYQLYRALAKWIEENVSDYDDFNEHYKKVVSSFFSSASAFVSNISKLRDQIAFPNDMIELMDKWLLEEKSNVKNIADYMEDPTDYESRMTNIIDYIDQEAYGKKVLIFTSFIETFEIYHEVLNNYFGKDHCVFFSKNMSSDERELAAYRFETDNEYWILLSDETGGEGRNFQNADIVLHIDLPWNANDLEQRIGRLDRIGREKDKPVISVVCYSQLSLENDLFKFWNDGIGIFTKSQSGLEIIMNDMDEKIIHAVCKDFKYGLVNMIEEASAEIVELKQTITKERYFDVAEYKYQSINQIMDNTREMYVMNERQLFGDSMMRWSALSGFHGSTQGPSTIRFDASSFSIKSAYKSLFVPADLKLMINDEINQLQNKVRMLNSDKLRHTDSNYIQGTFDRNIALNNDYIHFFAPGDPIFDSIVNNSLGSYRGTCSAFACKTSMDWTGFIFTWALQPDENILLEKNVSTHLIDKYRGFMPIEQFQCAVSIGEDEMAEEEVLRLYNFLLTSDTVNRKAFQHLGQRSGITPKIELFCQMYPEEQWKMITEDSYAKALTNAKIKIARQLKKQLIMLKTELVKNNAAQKASTNYYGSQNGENNEEKNKMIFNCFSKPKIILDSVCYVRMIND